MVRRPNGSWRSPVADRDPMRPNGHRAVTEIHTGRPHPLGATAEPGGVNFSVFSRSAEAVQLALYDDVDDPDTDAT